MTNSHRQGSGHSPAQRTCCCVNEEINTSHTSYPGDIYAKIRPIKWGPPPHSQPDPHPRVEESSSPSRWGRVGVTTTGVTGRRGSGRVAPGELTDPLREPGKGVIGSSHHVLSSWPQTRHLKPPSHELTGCDYLWHRAHGLVPATESQSCWWSVSQYNIQCDVLFFLPQFIKHR
jgi:hypothetical protein